jgi:hypothetical protein
MAASKPSKVRVYAVKPLSESELDNGFAISAEHPFYKSVVWLLTCTREEQIALAATLNEQEKTHAASAALGGADILGTLIYDLESKRKSAERKTNA